MVHNEIGIIPNGIFCLFVPENAFYKQFTDRSTSNLSSEKSHNRNN